MRVAVDATTVNLQGVALGHEAVGAHDLALHGDDGGTHKLCHAATRGTHDVVVPLAFVNVFVEVSVAAQAVLAHEAELGEQVEIAVQRGAGDLQTLVDHRLKQRIGVDMAVLVVDLAKQPDSFRRHPETAFSEVVDEQVELGKGGHSNSVRYSSSPMVNIRSNAWRARALKSRIFSDRVASFWVCGWLATLAIACSPNPVPTPPLTGPTPISTPAGPGALAPHLSVAPGGVLLSWLEPLAETDGHRLMVSQLVAERWQAAREVVRGDDFFANWADVPSVVASGDGRWLAHWLRKLGEGTYAYGAALAASTDEGASWHPLGLLHDDDSPTEHGFVSFLPTVDGVRGVWLDGRATATGGAMQLRTTVVRDDGVAPSAILADSVCDCCPTAVAGAAAGAVVAYRGRTQDEHRDIQVVRQVGAGWSAPVAVERTTWKIAGCPVNGPAITADGMRVAVAWFTGEGARGRVQAAFSVDGGASFGVPVLLDDQAPLGRVSIALADTGAWVSWLATANGHGELRLQHVTPRGAAGPVRVVARTSGSRGAGVPRLVRTGNRLVMAWVEDTESRTLRSAWLPASTQ